MFRRPRQTEADEFSMRLGEILQNFTVIPWGTLAMWHLGVPIGLGSPMIVIDDNNYIAAIEKLKRAGFTQTVPNRTPAPEIMRDHPNLQQVLEERNAGYKRLDRSCAVFNYPHGDSEEKGMQLYLFPNSFAHFSLEDIPYPLKETKQFDTYGNLHYPLEEALVESFVKAAVDEENEDYDDFSMWIETLRAWISMMTGYLEVNNDILDYCPDKQAVEWYSINFGRIHEANFGPIDRRITKRLGSGKEMPVDMRRNSI